MKNSNDKFLSVKDVSSLTGFSLRALANQRTKKIGFPYYKFGRRVFYKESEVLACLGSNKVETTNQADHNAS